MTKRQKQIVDFIRDYNARHGISPTLEEIGASCGVTRMTIYEHVKRLVQKGVLRKDARSARGIEIVELETKIVEELKRRFEALEDENRKLLIVIRSVRAGSARRKDLEQVRMIDRMAEIHGIKLLINENENENENEKGNF